MAAVLAAAGGAACTPHETCPIDGTSCGGNPVGDWMVVNASASN